ncbi:MAG: hypothetical protein QF886_02160, partial [Planctomycetota bacterium]|nr:hypothetical protein [Planctomycetota bacterium]
MPTPENHPAMGFRFYRPASENESCDKSQHSKEEARATCVTRALTLTHSELRITYHLTNKPLSSAS